MGEGKSATASGGGQSADEEEDEVERLSVMCVQCVRGDSSSNSGRDGSCRCVCLSEFGGSWW